MWLGFHSFLNFIDKKSTEEITPKEVERFLKHLTKKREEWQVTQAEKAIRIYLYYEAHKNRPLSIHNEGSNDQWKVVAEEMKNILRLGLHFNML